MPRTPEGTVFTCPDCAREFKRKVLFDRHLKRKNKCRRDEYIVCKACGEHINRAAKDLQAHVERCAVQRPLDTFTKEELYQVLAKRTSGMHDGLHMAKLVDFEREDDTFLDRMTVEDVRSSFHLGDDCQELVDMFKLTNLNLRSPHRFNVRFANDGALETVINGEWHRMEVDDFLGRALVKSRLRFYNIESQVARILGPERFKHWQARLDEKEMYAAESPRCSELLSLKAKLLDAVRSYAMQQAPGVNDHRTASQLVLSENEKPSDALSQACSSMSVS